MKSCLQYLSSLFQAGQSVYGYRDKWKYYYALSLGLILFSLPAATIAIESSYSEVSECGSLSATWTWSDTESGPPFFFLILPFGAQPTIVEIPDKNYDVTRRTGFFQFDKLKMKTGTEFIVSILSGDGAPFSGPIQFKALTLPFFHPSSQQAKLVGVYLLSEP